MSDQPSVEDVVARMLEIRDQLKAEKEAYEAKAKKLKQMQERGESWLLQHMQDTGHDSFNLDALGVNVHTRTNQRYSVSDWPALAGYIKDTGELDLLGHRVSSSSAKQFAEKHGGLPPGVTVNPVVSVNIRKK